MDTDSDPKPETLAESFTQSKRELKFILGTWLVFFLWVAIVCSTIGRVPPGEEVPILFGMPRWVIFGVALPWVVATGVGVFFGLRVMKDTNLEGDGDSES